MEGHGVRCFLKRVNEEEEEEEEVRGGGRRGGGGEGRGGRGGEGGGRRRGEEGRVWDGRCKEGKREETEERYGLVLSAKARVLKAWCQLMMALRGDGPFRRKQGLGESRVAEDKFLRKELEPQPFSLSFCFLATLEWVALLHDPAVKFCLPTDPKHHDGATPQTVTSDLCDL